MGSRGSRIAPDGSDNIIAVKSSRNASELSSFLGLHNVFRRFVLEIASISFPLNEKAQINQPFILY